MKERQNRDAHEEKCQVLTGWPREVREGKGMKHPNLSKGVTVALRRVHVRNSYAQIGDHHRTTYMERNEA